MIIIFEKKYQVFISSTYNDLINERREVIQALLELGCFPTGMELFQASDLNQWNWIKQVINDCDYFIVIIAGRYGTIHEKYGISYTEMEYRYALEIKKPIIGFLHKNIDLLPVSKSETNPVFKKKLIDFRELASHKLIKYWGNEYELASVVSRSVIHLIQTTPMPGWIKADSYSGNEINNLTDNSMQHEKSNSKDSLSNKENNLIDNDLIKRKDDPIQNSLHDEETDSEEIKCNFCQKPQSEATLLICGPNKIYICDECVDICYDIINEELQKREKENYYYNDSHAHIDAKI